MHISNRLPFRLIAALTVAVVPQTQGEPVPISPGERYYLTFAQDQKPLPMWRPDVPVKVVRLFDYPWVEVEYSWAPRIKIDLVDGKKDEDPEPEVYRRFLNLDHVVAIAGSDEVESRQEEVLETLKGLIEKEGAAGDEAAGEAAEPRR